MTAPLPHAYDIAIVGSGYAGSLMAMIARRLGLSVLLLERGTHPRVVIGESSTPLSNLLLEELALRYDLPCLLPLTKWGTWQEHYPELACGLKRGFTFHHHVLGHPRPPARDRQDQLLVAASPHDGIADTHWYRAGVDAFLMQEARKMGAVYADSVQLESFSSGAGVQLLRGTREATEVAYQARFVVDATGPRGFLHQALNLQAAALPGAVATQALYNHFVNVKRLEDTTYSRTPEPPPYPVDDAAVHHVFDGGWVWVLRFNNGVTSAGLVATDAMAETLALNEANDAAWSRILGRIPALQEQFRAATPRQAFTHVPRLSFSSATIAGSGWAMLPSAAGFVDPMLSTGFPLALLGVGRLARILENHWGAPSLDSALHEYATSTRSELAATSRLIGSLYATTGNFQAFTALSLLYFAAASFAETARRVGRPELAPSFLLHDHPEFGPACLALYEEARQLRSPQDTEQFTKGVLRAIERFDIAGLSDRTRNNWYPVCAADLLASARKLGATPGEITTMLARCGFNGSESVEISF